MPTADPSRVFVPPRWFVRLAWRVHRRIYAGSGGRRGLRRARPGREGYLCLVSTGRRSGQERRVLLAYLEDGPDLVTLAMNGWSEGEPAWWLNLLATPDAVVELVDGARPVRAHAATGAERERLWARWRELDEKLDDYAARRPGETAVVVLAPRADTDG
ncbi:nitroreductase/quinone reductase family protein [Desertihabitans aurantiacus]|uniref:nitroreductase/quinone reductase family protein n=1 Tax=Desertihabitans aurantiacus TaxID=2282477 RepID=UPI000DF862B5|nr:nitroreductase/quinone reductase family protein [Desertihabitans aurantiacus]